MTSAISELLIAKYVSAKTISDGRIALRVAGCETRGFMPEMKKNRRDEHQAETAGAEILNNARSTCGRRRAIQNEITKPSSATVSVPADGPYKNTAVKTKAYKVEDQAGAHGTSIEV